MIEIKRRTVTILTDDEVKLVSGGAITYASEFCETQSCGMTCDFCDENTDPNTVFGCDESTMDCETNGCTEACESVWCAP